MTNQQAAIVIGKALAKATGSKIVASGCNSVDSYLSSLCQCGHPCVDHYGQGSLEAFLLPDGSIDTRVATSGCLGNDKKCSCQMFAPKYEKG